LGDPAPLAAAALREALAGLAARRRSQERAAEKARRAAWAWQQVYAATVANLAAQAAVRQAAGAWRQGVFFLSLCDAPEAVIAGLPAADADAARVVEGLRQVAAGGRFGPDGVVGGGRRLLGWSVGPHWLG
jgi:Tfp pilus assembly protein PilV